MRNITFSEDENGMGKVSLGKREGIGRREWT